MNENNHNFSKETADFRIDFGRFSDKGAPNLGPAADFEKLSDKDLYSYCKKVGFNARIWSRKFIATIPEVAKRRLYKKYGYCSIHEFAAKLAGVSQKNTDDVLWISEKFKEMPKMKALIGEIGLSKLKVVACIATKETDDFWAQKVKNLTKSSLEIYVKEIRMRNGADSNGVVNNNKTKILDLQGRIVEKFPGECGRDCMEFPFTQEQIGMFDFEKSISQNINDASVEKIQNHDKKTFTIQIDDETEFELRKFKLQIEKERKEPIDWNTALKEMVKSALNEKLNEQKVQPIKSQPDVKSATASGPRTKPEKIIPKFKDSLVNKQMESAKQKPVSRYIPAKIKPNIEHNQSKITRYIPAKTKHFLQQKYHGHCAYSGCNKPAEQIHHTDRFAHKPKHENLIPLCKNHHDFIHQNSTNPQNIEVDKIFNAYKMKYCP